MLRIQAPWGCFLCVCLSQCWNTIIRRVSSTKWVPIEINEANEACRKFIPKHKILADLMPSNTPSCSFWKIRVTCSRSLWFRRIREMIPVLNCRWCKSRADNTSPNCHQKLQWHILIPSRKWTPTVCPKLWGFTHHSSIFCWICFVILCLRQRKKELVAKDKKLMKSEKK